MKTREIFSFLPLKNNSVIIGLSFLLLRISANISPKKINILRFLFELYSSMFLLISSISFEYSLKASESLNFYASYWWTELLNWLMNLFFQIQSLQLLISYMDDQEFVANLDYVFHVFFCNIIKVNLCIFLLYCYI